MWQALPVELSDTGERLTVRYGSDNDPGRIWVDSDGTQLTNGSHGPVTCKLKQTTARSVARPL
jgi:hypothetical protein